MKRFASILLANGFLVGFFLVDVSGAAAADNWPQWRGPAGSGVAEGEDLPDTWSATRNVLWKRDVPGRGWSSPIVWQDRVFLTTVVNQGESESPKKGLYFGGERFVPPQTLHQWKVICLDLAGGEVRWERQVHKGTPAGPMHIKNSYASETPVTDGQRVYCYFGNLGLFCFTLDGQPAWERRCEARATRFGWGAAASPALADGRLYVVNDNEEESYLEALDAATGNLVWRVARDERSNWATPFIWRNSLRTEIITPGTGKVRAYNLDGKLLYEFGGMSTIAIPTPVTAGDLLYVSSGYALDLRKPLFAIRPGASGDISLADDQTAGEYVAWCQKQAGPYNPSPIVYRRRVYVLLDHGFLACYDAASGEQVYSKRRFPQGEAFTSSPWAYDGKLFCLSEDGVASVVEAGSKFKILHANALADDDMCMATPAIASGKLLIRTAARIYCIAKPTKKNVRHGRLDGGNEPGKRQGGARGARR
ncbi:MAG TPA: PQQ-binding-like beta-propeller repeat protein [Pirellulales bacterium]|nr:PQQ-binding-like beta-propeller repeat protein [Pirellulales bacterium]